MFPIPQTTDAELSRREVQAIAGAEFILASGSAPVDLANKLRKVQGSSGYKQRITTLEALERAIEPDVAQASANAHPGRASIGR